MPGKRITELTAIAGASTANDDNLVIFDTSEGTTKRILRSQLATGLVGDLPYTPAGFISATTVPSAIAEIASDLSASAGASLVGFLQAGTGAVQRTTQAKLREIAVSVKDFGAVGDGVTDDTAAIQAAINSGAGAVFFPRGVYLVRDATNTASGAVLQTVSDQVLYGEGDASEIKLGAHTTATHYVIRTHSTNNIKIQNLKINGNKTQQTGVGDQFSHCVHIRNSLNVTIENCTLVDSIGDGIDVYATSDTGTQNIQIIGNRFNNNTRQGISIVRGLNVRIIGNDIANTSGSSPGAGIDIESDGAAWANDTIVISGNNIRGNYWGVLLFSTAPARKITVIGNTFKGNRSADVFVRAENVTISGNSIELDGKTATYAGIDIDNSRQISITGNTIIGSYGAQERGGIRVSRNVVGLSITGNTIEKTLNPGITVYPFSAGTGGTGPVRSVSIVGNTLYNCCADSSVSGPILIGGATSHELFNVTITGNAIYDTRTGGLEPDFGIDWNFTGGTPTNDMMKTISVFNNTIVGPTKQMKPLTSWQWQGQIFSFRATLDFDLTSVTTQDLTVTSPGVAENDCVFLGVPNGAVTDEILFWAWVSAADTITVRAMRVSATARNPGSANFNITVVKMLTR